MTRPEPVIVDIDDDGIALVQLNRPDKLNPMDYDLLDFAARTIESLAHDNTCQAVILTGSGRAFSAGADLAGFDVLNPATSDIPAMLRLASRAGDLVTALHTIPKPVIAAVNGPAMGGGFSLALACDTRICDQSAKFSAAFVKVGLSGCEMGISYLLPRIVGATHAFDLCASGRTISASEAERLGIVLAVVPGDELLPAARERARSYLANSPIGLRMTKEVLRQNMVATSLHDALATEARTQVLCAHTSDHREAYLALTERRPPKFTNR